MSSRWLCLYVNQNCVLARLGPWGGDHNYTMGVGLQWGGAWISRRHLDSPLNGPDALSRLDKIHGRFRNEAGAGNFIESHTFALAA